ncbi:hypothetical protein CPB84DRAFT_796732 [Gymnopilus junonius]|uniref:Uncharacterized protein n=1 Tax=Gymnopilus junonius TaxID=109634 RepID=A0A9P5TQ72_GYMJU|nr:hypothetical protein CPB84DRAFT_796732 [Gymnopilus junonius]
MNFEADRWSFRRQLSTNQVPQWMTDALAALLARHPNDRLEIVSRESPDVADDTPVWRVRCRDCPGKQYIPGPGETLLNFQVHLKNRQHRRRVKTRLAGLARRL